MAIINSRGSSSSSVTCLVAILLSATHAAVDELTYPTSPWIISSMDLLSPQALCYRADYLRFPNRHPVRDSYHRGISRVGEESERYWWWHFINNVKAIIEWVESK